MKKRAVSPIMICYDYAVPECAPLRIVCKHCGVTGQQTSRRVQIVTPTGKQWWCGWCFGMYAGLCYNCRCYYERPMLRKVQSGAQLCPSCANKWRKKHGQRA
jgi:hypothetical protein